MKPLLVFILIGITIAGCFPIMHVDTATQEATRSVVSSTTTRIPEVAATEESTSKSNPMAITVRPPMVPISTVLPLKGWQTFTSAALGVTVDYPSDWSATEQTEGITFMSPEGKTIQLQTITTSSDKAGSGNNNQQCAPTLINSYGLSIDACVDTSTHMYSAKFNLQSSSSSAQQWFLLTTRKDTLEVYLRMLNLLRPA